MVWAKGKSGNPGGNFKEKPFRDALRKVLYENDREALDKIARALVKRAAQEGDPVAVREIADRLEGKVPQAIVGDDEHEPIRHIVRWEKDGDDA
jgi:hypothetical protein